MRRFAQCCVRGLQVEAGARIHVHDGVSQEHVCIPMRSRSKMDELGIEPKTSCIYVPDTVLSMRATTVLHALADGALECKYNI